jgi:S-adenosylmethionine:tRNA ribosyltransferase-isomerase
MRLENLETEYTLEDFNYHLPDNLIAQTPTDKRSDSRLMVVNKEASRIVNSNFNSLEKFLQSGDILVFNNTRVLHARIFCERIHGGKVELVLTRKINDTLWLTISNRTGRLKPGELIYPVSDKNISLKITGREGEYLKIESSKPLTDDVLNLYFCQIQDI